MALGDLHKVYLNEFLDQMVRQPEVFLHPAFLCLILSLYLPYYQLGFTLEEYVLGPQSLSNPESYQYGFVFRLIVGGRELKLYPVLEDFSF